MVYCVAANCNSDSTKCSAANGVHFHAFPTDAKRRKDWTVRCRRHESWKPGSKARICSKHFTSDAYLRSPDVVKSIGFGSMKPLLKDDAVPTLFVHNPSPGTPTSTMISQNKKRRTTGHWRIQKEVRPRTQIAKSCLVCI